MSEPKDTDPAVVPPKGTVLVSAAILHGEKLGDKIGHYKLLQLINEGGMGTVWLAEQTEPIRRKIALKVIKLGMDTKDVISRFEAERQILALMDHPNIAKVLDAGATEIGRPYFVMEYVTGLAITDYCDRHTLPTPQRLELFIQVCGAIEHAHRNGIIHRDIKPSNILVTLNDAAPAPKVIDFGIAKATGGQLLADKIAHTAVGDFIGTPAYTSPEQAEMTGLDIDRRSDIYSLGVLLYELLTGHTPFDGKRLAQAGRAGIPRILREEEPLRPSTKMSKLELGEQTAIAKCRQTEPPKLIHSVRGDLDWIVMKCLEKDRTRRYQTAEGLALDIQRHLNNEPLIEARPTSSLRRFQKLARRNQKALTGACVAAVVTILLLFLTLVIFRESVSRALAVPPPKVIPAELKALPAANVLEMIYTGYSPAAPAGAAPPRLQFEIEARRKGESDFSPLQDGDAMVSEVDDFLMVAHTLSAGYLYIFQVDASGKTQWLFPENNSFPYSSGANPVKAGQTVQSPSAEKKAFYLDRIAGVEHVYVVFSAARWPGLEAALSSPSQPAPPAGSVAALVREPNRLLTRGIEGTHDIAFLTPGSTPVSVERIEHGKTYKLLIGGRPSVATGAFLVIERWFRHVDDHLPK